jgi:dynein regulatry complex protein 1
MDMILDEAGFLLEPVVMKKIEALPTDEQDRVRLDALLEALGVCDCTGLEALVEALDPSSDVELRAKGMGTSEKAALKAQPVLVSPDDALRRLRAFVEAENASGIQGGSNKPTVAGPRAGVSRRVMERERDFWRKITKVVDERGRRIFSSLETNLHKYYVLLQSREKSLREVEQAGKQNTELRALLNQYLSSTINKELQIPPTQLI